MPHSDHSDNQTRGMYCAADLACLTELQIEANSLYTKRELETALSEYYKARDMTPCDDVPPFFSVWYMAVEKRQDRFADELYQRLRASDGCRYVSLPSSS